MFDDHNRMVVAVDFDGTIVEKAYPEIGKPFPHVWSVLKELQAAEYHLVLWTCRYKDKNRDYLQEAVDFCAEYGMFFQDVNDHPLFIYTICSQSDAYPCPRKIYYDYLIDDKNLGGFPGWLWVRTHLLGY